MCAQGLCVRRALYTGCHSVCNVAKSDGCYIKSATLQMCRFSACTPLRVLSHRCQTLRLQCCQVLWLQRFQTLWHYVAIGAPSTPVAWAYLLSMVLWHGTEKVHPGDLASASANFHSVKGLQL